MMNGADWVGSNSGSVQVPIPKHSISIAVTIQAEAVGFEPTDLSISGFQDRCTKPDYATLPLTRRNSVSLHKKSLNCCYRLRATNRTRTRHLLITSELLYLMSYCGIGTDYRLSLPGSKECPISTIPLGDWLLRYVPGYCSHSLAT